MTSDEDTIDRATWGAPAAGIVEAMERGLIVGGLRPGIREANVLRLAPPLVVTEAEIDDALAILQEALSAVERSARR